MTILTINLWDLPYLTKNRDQRITSFLAQHSQLRPDILCIQEVWESSVRRLLADRLAAHYDLPEICLRTRLRYLDRTGGLMTFVRKGIPIFGSSFTRFHDNGFLSVEDMLARKGFLTVTVKLCGFLALVVNIHLHMRLLGTEHYHRKVRLGQIKEIFGSVSDQNNVLLAGDFNCEPGSREYQRIIGVGFEDAAGSIPVPIESTINTVYGLEYLNRLLVSRKRRVDYFFTKHSSAVRIVNPKLVFVEQLVSDHYGMIAEIL